nr:MAG TPA: hypothetical protein [Caudoviricetes sp.]
MLDRIRTLARPQYARKMHLRYITAREFFIFNELNTFRTRVQLPPAQNSPSVITRVIR